MLEYKWCEVSYNIHMTVRNNTIFWFKLKTKGETSVGDEKNIICVLVCVYLSPYICSNQLSGLAELKHFFVSYFHAGNIMWICVNITVEMKMLSKLFWSFIFCHVSYVPNGFVILFYEYRPNRTKMSEWKKNISMKQGKKRNREKVLLARGWLASYAVLSISKQNSTSLVKTGSSFK